MAGKKWYLLRNHRVEGPLKLEDLKVMATTGKITPDDYMVEESDYRQGKMTYKKVIVYLQESEFKIGLERPSAASSESEKKNREMNVGNNDRDSISANIENYSSSGNHETVSGFASVGSNLSFAKVASFCVAVIVGMWGYDTIFGGKSNVRGVAATADSTSSAKRMPSARKSVILSQPKKEEVAGQRVQKLVPSERPGRSLMPTTRPELATTPLPDSATPDVIRERGIPPDTNIAGDGDDYRGDSQDRGLASEENEIDRYPNDLQPEEMVPPPDEMRGDIEPNGALNDEQFDSDY